MQSSFFGTPNLGDLGPCNVYAGTQGLQVGTAEFKKKWIGKTSSTTVRPARFSYVDFTSSQDGAEPYDRAISGQGANVESSIVTPSADIMSLLIPGFTVERDASGNIDKAYMKKIIGSRLSDYESEMIVIRFRNGQESKDRKDMLLFKRVWPSIETLEMVFDAATPREIASLIYEAKSFPYTVKEGTADEETLDVYWSFVPELRLDVTAPGEVTGLTATAGSQKVDLAWTNPTDIDLSKIHITWTPGDGKHTIRSKTTTSYAVTNLTASTPYTFTVQTEDRAGNMSAGVTVMGTPTA